jgi:hypothetical protein
VVAVARTTLGLFSKSLTKFWRVFHSISAKIRCGDESGVGFVRRRAEAITWSLERRLRHKNIRVFISPVFLQNGGHV